MKNRTLGDSFKNALNGIFYVIKAERNMKLHILSALVVIFLSVNYRLNKIETILVCLAIGLVLVCELLNTAIEVLVDLVMESYHPKAKIVKDAAAGGVLMSAIVSVIIGYIIFIDSVGKDAQKVVEFLRGLDLKITIAISAGIIILLVIINIFLKKEVFIKGIIDTGIAFIVSSIAAVVVLWNGNIQNSILFLGICVLIILSRVKRKLQNIYNLLIGAIPGFLAVLVIYQAIKG